MNAAWMLLSLPCWAEALFDHEASHWELAIWRPVKRLLLEGAWGSLDTGYQRSRSMVIGIVFIPTLAPTLWKAERLEFTRVVSLKGHTVILISKQESKEVHQYRHISNLQNHFCNFYVPVHRNWQGLMDFINYSALNLNPARAGCVIGSFLTLLLRIAQLAW